MQIKKYTPYFLSILAGILLALSFPPLNLWPFAFIALVPLFFAIKGQSVKKSFWLGLITGIVFYSIYGFWLIFSMIHFSVSPIFFPIIVIFISLSFGLATSLITYLKKYNFIIITPIVWTTAEYFKTITQFSFPGGIIAYSQYLNSSLIQISSVFGIWFISFIIVAINAWLFIFFDKKKLTKEIKISGLLILLLVTAILIFSAIKIYEKNANKTIKIALIQTNFSFEAGSNKTDILSLIKQAEKENPDLIILPETSFKRAEDLPKEHSANILTGLRTQYNSAVLLKKNKETQIYHKMKLIQFYETTPYNEIFPKTIRDNLKAKLNSRSEIEPGKDIVIFKTNNFSFFVLICSEEMYGDLTRESAQLNPDFITTISNDGFSNAESGKIQHASMLVFRAIETGLPVARVGNTGPTWIIDKNGRIQQDINLSETGIIYKNIAYGGSKQTIYTKYGDFFALSCLIAVLSLILFNSIDRKNK